MCLEAKLIINKINFQVIETEIIQWEQRIGDLVALGQEMAQEGHFDADNILKASKECQEK